MQWKSQRNYDQIALLGLWHSHCMIQLKMTDSVAGCFMTGLALPDWDAHWLHNENDGMWLVQWAQQCIPTHSCRFDVAHSKGG